MWKCQTILRFYNENADFIFSKEGFGLFTRSVAFDRSHLPVPVFFLKKASKISANYDFVEEPSCSGAFPWKKQYIIEFIQWNIRLYQISWTRMCFRIGLIGALNVSLRIILTLYQEILLLCICVKWYCVIITSYLLSDNTQSCVKMT